jgi:hypothetical protein
VRLKVFVHAWYRQVRTERKYDYFAYVEDWKVIEQLQGSAVRVPHTQLCYGSFNSRIAVTALIRLLTPNLGSVVPDIAAFSDDWALTLESR